REVDNAAPVLIGEYAHRLAPVLDRLLLHGKLLGEDADRGKLVLDLLKRREHALPVIGDAFHIGGARGIDLRAGQAAVEQRLRRACPDRSDRTGGGKRQRNVADELNRGGQRNVGKIRGLGDANQRVVLLHGALGGGDIGTPFQERRGQRDRNFRNSPGQHAPADRQLRRRS